MSFTKYSNNNVSGETAMKATETMQEKSARNAERREFMRQAGKISLGVPATALLLSVTHKRSLADSHGYGSSPGIEYDQPNWSGESNVYVQSTTTAGQQSALVDGGGSSLQSSTNTGSPRPSSCVRRRDQGGNYFEVCDDHGGKGGPEH